MAWAGSQTAARLAGLDRAARATGGATTCAGVRIADGAIEAFGAGDSLVFVLAGTTARPILPEHASARGLIDCLGHPRFHGSTARIEGKPEAVLLCTDGVHRVATNHALATALRESRHGVSAALDQLMLGINETTDNATALLIATR
jgi:serine/threonine protein phosphatase PrpC